MAIKNTETGEISYTGRVLHDRGEHNYLEDSDFFALVWDDATQAPKEIPTWSTRGAGYMNRADVDATDETRELYAAYLATERRKRDEAVAAAVAATPSKGKRVTVVRGRNVPVGTTGTVIWRGEAKNYSRSRYASVSYRVGIKDEDGTVWWTAESNVEVSQDTVPAPAEDDALEYAN